MSVAPNFQRNAQIAAGLFQHFADSKVTRFNNNQSFRFQSCHVVAKYLGEVSTAIICWLNVQFMVLDVDLASYQLIAKMSHT